MLYTDVVHSSGFLDHAVLVTEVEDRRAFIAERCHGRDVLHVGCADVPVFDPDTNLHVHLSKHTRHLDGLDVSEEGLAVLRRHVAGDYYTRAADVTAEYDVVLAPEVIEHVGDAHRFLTEVFSVKARHYLITAPHLAWFSEMRSEPGIFFERVHPDHKAWYSPYTLLAAVRPFIALDQDDVQVLVFNRGASVGVWLSKPYEPQLRPRRRDDRADPLGIASTLVQCGDTGAALAVLSQARAANDGRELFSAHAKLLLRLGQNMEALRQALAWLKTHDGDRAALLLCADAAEAIGEHEHARRWRRAAG